MDKLYSFIMRGELAKVSLNKTDIVSRHSNSDIIEQEYIKSMKNCVKKFLRLCYATIQIFVIKFIIYI